MEYTIDPLHNFWFSGCIKAIQLVWEARYAAIENNEYMSDDQYLRWNRVREYVLYTDID